MYSLGGVHTHTHTHTHTHSRSESDFKKPGARGRRTPGLKKSTSWLLAIITFVYIMIYAHIMI